MRLQFNKNTFYFLGVQLDLLSLRDQLATITQTDILIGMHGAAFAFTFFMSPGGGAIELFPWKYPKNWHMQYLAKWNKVKYARWLNVNRNMENVPAKSTYIPTRVVECHLAIMFKDLCPSIAYNLTDHCKVFKSIVQEQNKV